MLLGPVEDQSIKKGSLDVIALMDVMEHLPDPVGSMRHCLRLLKPDGILLIQTPSFPQDKNYRQMVKEKDPFQGQLKKEEHLYLFSQDSIREFFCRLGAESVNFEPAIFSLYDMFLVVSRIPPTTYFQEEIEKGLSTTLSGRMLQALLDLGSRDDFLNKKLQESEADRAARLEVIHDRERQIQEIEEDRKARLKLIEDLGRQLGQSEADRASMKRSMEGLQKRLEESEAERTIHAKAMEDLSRRFEASEMDRAARLEVIRNCERWIQEIEADRAARLKVIEDLGERLETIEADRAARLGIIQTQIKLIEVQRAELIRSSLMREMIGLSRVVPKSEVGNGLTKEK